MILIYRMMCEEVSVLSLLVMGLHCVCSVIICNLHLILK